MGKQETVLAVLKKCPRCLVYVRQYANVFSVGPFLYFINREDRRYTKKMTLANKCAIFIDFCIFIDLCHRFFTLSVPAVYLTSVSDGGLCFGQLR